MSRSTVWVKHIEIDQNGKENYHYTLEPEENSFYIADVDVHNNEIKGFGTVYIGVDQMRVRWECGKNL